MSDKIIYDAIFALLGDAFMALCYTRCDDVTVKINNIDIWQKIDQEYNDEEPIFDHDLVMSHIWECLCKLNKAHALADGKDTQAEIKNDLEVSFGEDGFPVLTLGFGMINYTTCNDGSV